MAQKVQGQEGAGKSKIITAQEHADNKRRAKARKRNRGGRPGEILPGATLFDQINGDRSQQRQESRQFFLEKITAQALTHLSRYANSLVNDGKGGERTRWSATVLGLAQDLMRTYFLNDDIDVIATEEGALTEGVLKQVRRKFVMTCLLRKVKGAPGQKQDWYPALAAETQEYLGRRSAA